MTMLETLNHFIFVFFGVKLTVRRIFFGRDISSGGGGGVPRARISTMQQDGEISM
jgi:hypothetical protein